MMDIRFRLEEKGLYRMMNAALLACVGLFGVGRYFGIDTPGFLHILLALIVVVLLAIFNSMSAKGRILSIVGVLGCLGATGIVVGFENGADFLTSYGYWLLGENMWQEEWLVGYEVMQTLLLAMICYLLQVVLEKDFRIKIGMAILLLVGVVYCLLAEKELSHVSMALVVCYLVMVLTEWTGVRWKKVKSKSTQAYMLWMMPFILVYLIGLLCMPVPEKPYDWQFFKDVYQQLSESFRTISLNVLSIGREDFDSALSGFAEEGTLGGGFRRDNREIMTIKSGSSLMTNVYLTGKVYDSFDGRQWQKENEDVAMERYLDTVQTLYAVQNYDKEYQGDYLYRTTLNICYEDFSSRYLFAPLKAWSVEQGARTLAFEESEGSLLFDTKKGYGTEYSVIYYQLNMGQEAFYEFLEAEQEPDDKLLRDALIGLKGRTDVVLTEEDLKNHKQLIYENYLADVDLSEGVLEYLEQITKDAETDVEKLGAIEAALASMTYTKTPGELPDTVVDSSTFLDYFLLESKQGYCSHYATAYVLLARAEGIPARYVQGYCVPMEGDEEVKVTSDMAHAWPEVYLDDIGWIPFEPTPGFGEVRYTPWKIKKGETVISSDFSGNYGVGAWEEYEEEEDLGGDFVDLGVSAEATRNNNIRQMLRILGLSVATVFVIGTLIIFLERLIGRWRYGKMSDTQKYMLEIRKNLRILSRLEIERDAGETLEELKVRMSEYLNQEEEFCFLEDYEEFIYGAGTVDSQMIQHAKEEQEMLLRILKQRKRWAYLYYSIFVNEYRA